MSGEVWTLAYFLKEATTVWRGPCRQAVPCPLLYPMVVTIFYYWHIMLSRPQVGTRKCWRSMGWPQWLSSISWSVLGPTMCLMWWGFSREVKADKHARYCSMLSMLMLTLWFSIFLPLLSTKFLIEVYRGHRAWLPYCQGVEEEELESRLPREEMGA